MARLLQKMVTGDGGARAGEPAVTDRHGVTSWGELDHRVNQLIGVLRSLGVGQGERVALLSGNRREVYEMMQAVAHSGVLMVPINWHFAADEVRYVVENSGSRALFVDPTYAAAAEGVADDLGIPRFDFTDHERGGHSTYEDALAAQSPAEPDDQQMGGVMFYTSGTTGRPKGVRNTAFGAGGVPPEVYELMAAGMVNMGFPPNGRTLLCGPHYHSAQWAFSFFPMIGGSSVVIQERFVPEETLRLIDQHAITNVHLVPTQFVRLLRADEAAKAAFSGASLELVLHGAAPCSPQVKRQMIEWWGPTITEYYGATEGGVVSVITAETWLQKPGSVGKPLPNFIVRIQPEDDEGGAVGEGAVGEEGAPPFVPGTIHIRNTMGTDFEYLGEPDKTKDAHRLEGMFTLGDIGYLDDEGYLFLSDRKIDMIISGGVNIYPAEIEGVLTAHPAVVDAAVFGVPDEEFGEQVKAAVQLAPGAVWDTATEAAVVAHARQHLAGYKVPRSFDVVTEMPRSEAGKLLKRELRAPYWDSEGRSI